jgi:predicted YcjX-like family ATPase
MTMDAGSRDLFLRLIAQGSGSLLQYVSETSPWSPGAAHAMLDKVRALASEERGEVTRFTRWLQRKHERVPFFGSYPSHFTTTNFVSIDFLLPKLVTENTREIAEGERLVSQIGDEEVRTLAQTYVDMKKRHLEALQGLTAAKTPVAV